jgi:hypothetical protein
MDKLKEQLAPVQKQIFWILCGIILLVSLFSWYQATSHLKTEQERLKGDIDSKTSAVTAIPPNHPNDNTNKGMDELTRRYGEDVANAWALLTANQEKVLVWSTSVFDADFIRAVTPLRPPELKVKETLADEISRDDRIVARNRFEAVLPELAKTIGAKWGAKAQAAGMGMGGAVGDLAGGFGGAEPAAAGLDNLPGLAGQQQEEDDSIVIWNPGNQSDLLNNHFAFVTNESAIPTTLEVLYAQEDVWVLQNIMNIIKATNEYNGPISQRHQAAIKYIDSVRIGRTALGVAGKVSSPGTAGGGGGMGGGMPGMGGELDEGMMGAPMGGGMPGMEGGGVPTPGGAGGDPAGGGAGAGMPGGAGPGMAGGMPMPGMGGSGSGGTGTSSHPADNRYVDRDYKALSADRLKKAMRGEDPKDLLLAVAKRVPVRLHFKMDQRRLPELLAECGNSKLPVEIKQVRVNRQSGGNFGGDSGGMPGMAGGMPGMAGGMPGMAGGMAAGMPGGAIGGDEAAGGGAFPGMGGSFGGGGANPNRGKVSDVTLDPNEISVELYGIVYLYNPVNRAVLGLPPAETPATVAPTPTPASTTPRPSP